ncbi:hypothetical protein TCA2_2973 [Paenibacillus sp. TCA20]|nr:hypothetical protein TCA2_2973 [Paenibacillus sp. TCA20]
MLSVDLPQFLEKRFGDVEYGAWFYTESAESLYLWLGTEGADRLIEKVKMNAMGLPLQQHMEKLVCRTLRVEGSTLLFIYFSPNDASEQRPMLMLIEAEDELTDSELEQLELLTRMELLTIRLAKQKLDHERWLEGLRALTSSLDLNELLLHIMQNALKVIPAADCGFFMMYEEAEKRLVPRASIGIKDTIYQFQTRHSQGITGKVFTSGIGKIYTSRTALDAMDDVPKDALSYLVNAFDGDVVQVVSVIAVPVTMNQDRIGVMLVHQLQDGRRPFHDQDLLHLQGFADQAAIAISNARMYSELREANEYLVKRSDIHNVFTKLSVRQESVEVLVDQVLAMLKLPLRFVDLLLNNWHPVADDQHELSDLDLFQVFEANKAPVTITGSHEHGYYLYPVVNGPVLLGVFVIPLLRPLEPLDHIVLEQGGAIVALQLMNTHSATEMYYKRSHEFFNELVQFREPERVAAKMSNFGLPKDVPLFVSVLHLLGEHGDLKQREIFLRKLILDLEKELGHSEKLLFGSHDKVTIIAAALNIAQQKQMVERMRAAAERWARSTGKSVSGGIGSLYSGLEQVARSNDEALDALSFLLRRQKTGLTRYEDIGVNQLFLNQEPAKIGHYIESVLSPLYSRGKQQGEDLERTLKAYMAANRSASAAAEELHIHINTLYHRLHKVEELMQVSLNDPDDWLKVYLACHLSETY